MGYAFNNNIYNTKYNFIKDTVTFSGRLKSIQLNLCKGPDQETNLKLLYLRCGLNKQLQMFSCHKSVYPGNTHAYAYCLQKVVILINIT